MKKAKVLISLVLATGILFTGCGSSEKIRIHQKIMD